MKIKEYLGSIDMTVQSFSEALDIHPRYLSRIIHGRETPGRKLCKNIELLTEGKVKLMTKKQKAELEKETVK